MRIRNLLMLATGAGAIFGLASCGGEEEAKPKVEQSVDNSKIYEQLNALKPTASVQTNPLVKQGGSYYV